MNDMLRKRIWRKLKDLSDDDARVVLELVRELGADAGARVDEPASGRFQRFGERIEDELRRRDVPGRTRRGAMKILGATDRVLDVVRETGREFLAELERGRPEPAPGDEEPPRRRRVVRR